MTRKVPTRPVEPAEARDHAAKAEEYLVGARSELEAKRWTGATTLAVHAAINAVDAITGLKLRKRSAGEQHEQALVLLREVDEAKDARRHFGPLIKLKSAAEYGHTPIRRPVAEQAVRRAERLVEIARSIAATSG